MPDAEVISKDAVTHNIKSQPDGQPSMYMHGIWYKSIQSN